MNATDLREALWKIRLEASRTRQAIIENFQASCKHGVVVEKRGLRGIYMDDGYDPPVHSSRLCLECGLKEESRRGLGMNSAVDPVLDDCWFKTIKTQPMQNVKYSDFEKLEKEIFNCSLEWHIDFLKTLS